MEQSKQQWLLQRAKELRKSQTPQEIELWNIIRAKRFEGLKFYRQYIIDFYIVDFCCPEKMVLIELDGSGHFEKENGDQKRDEFLQKLGYRIIRVWNNDWDNNRNGVLEIIVRISNFPSPGLRPPSPRPGARGVSTAKKAAW